MDINSIVRAWKDQAFRQNLSPAEQAQLPAHPAGFIELTETDLGVVSGGATTANCHTNSPQCFHSHWFVCTLHPCS